jgi:hypothetical protein
VVCSIALKPQSDDLDARLRRSQIKQRQLKRRIKELIGEG